MDLETLKSALAIQGITLRRQGDQLLATPSSRLTEALRQGIREHKDVLLGWVERNPPEPLYCSVDWPAGADVAAIGHQWERLPDGRIRARYTWREFVLCLAALGSTDARRIASSWEERVYG